MLKTTSDSYLLSRPSAVVKIKYITDMCRNQLFLQLFKFDIFLITHSILLYESFEVLYHFQLIQNIL